MSNGVKTTITVDEPVLKRLKNMRIEAQYMKFSISNMGDAIDLLLVIWDMAKDNGTVDRHRLNLNKLDRGKGPRV